MTSFQGIWVILRLRFGEGNARQGPPYPWGEEKQGRTFIPAPDPGLRRDDGPLCQTPLALPNHIIMISSLQEGMMTTTTSMAHSDRQALRLSSERPAATFNGYRHARRHAGRWPPPVSPGWACSAESPVAALAMRRRGRARPRLRRGGLLSAPAQPGGGDPAVRRLSGHATATPASGGAGLADPDQDLDPGPQRHLGAAQGERPARQPDRDRDQRRLAGDRHRPGAVRRRRLQQVRLRPDRERGPGDRRQISL